MTKETKQLLMFLLGQEKGEIIRLLTEKHISPEAYRVLSDRITNATKEILK